MLKNYFTIAWRNLSKNKFFSFVNIFGLSAGLVCCMLIALYLHYETGYDNYQTHIKDLYQVGTVFIAKGGKDQVVARTPAPMARVLKEEFPEVVESARLVGLFTEDKTLLQYVAGNGASGAGSGEKKAFLEEKGALADPGFFRMFTYHFTEGSPSQALNDPNTMVVSEEIARKFFGNQPALNKVIHVTSSTNGAQDYTIKGVFRPIGQPSHIDTRFFLSFRGGEMEKYINRTPANFAINNMFYSYIQLKPGADAKQLETKLPAFMHKYADDDLKKSGMEKKQFLMPVRGLHLNDRVTANVTPVVSRTYLYILASIALFTLLIACINFMNLSTARSSKRSAEVGIRKVLGAEKGGLIRQFLGESLLMTLLAFAAALGMTVLLLPAFDHLSGKEIRLSVAGDWKLFAGFSGMAIATGLIAGSYPAFYLSSFNPVKVLKGKLSNSLAATSIRRGLVVFQFMISIILIISTVVIVKQMYFLRKADLGFDKDQQMIISLRSSNAQKIFESLKAELKNTSQVLSVGGTAYYPGIANPSDNQFRREGQSASQGILTKQNYVDADLMQTLNIKAVAGRLFSTAFTADTSGPVNHLLLNETAVKALGFASPQAAIGQHIYSEWMNKVNTSEIVGVVKDFHFEDLHVAVTPYAFARVTAKDGFSYLVVHTRAGNIGQVVRAAQNIWRKLDPNEPFEYTFLDDQFQRNYDADNRLAGIVGYFTVIAILISCLGLFGLAMFSAEQRTREIGVRKVLGASVSGIVALLSKDFLKLILLSIVIASPIAWYIMNKWLQGFAYRQPVNWVVFAGTTAIALTIGLLTIGFQAMKAALANPVKSLKSE